MFMLGFKEFGIFLFIVFMIVFILCLGIMGNFIIGLWFKNVFKFEL